MFGINKILIFLEDSFLTFFFSWKIPFASGTFWSIASFIFFFFFISYYKVSALSIFLFSIFISIISVFIIDNYEKRTSSHDDKSIVIDEFVWLWFSLAIILHFTENIYILFLWLFLFRLFDIWKPWVIWYVDKKISWWVWVVLDDLLAWIFAWFSSLIIFFLLKYLWIHL